MIPAFLNQTYATPAAAKSAQVGRLELAYCGACQFGFNAAFDPSLVVYTADYENEQSHSPAFAQHVDRMVERVLRTLEGGRGAVVEVGCGQGAFLRRLAMRMSGDEIRIFGIDPCYRQGLESHERLEFLASTLEQTDRRRLPDVAGIVLARHVIEHVARPVEFLRTLVEFGLLSAQSHLLLETPSFEWIVHNSMFMDIFYEHCNYFTCAALARTASAAGCRVKSIEPVFGDQYYWLAARLGQAGPISSVCKDRATLTSLEVERFAGRETSVRSHWMAELEASARTGPVAVWGSGAKGVTFTTLLDPGRSKVECLIDMNPAKQGRFIPLSGHPIRSLEAARRAGVTTAYVMNPNYLEEIRLMTVNSEFPIQLIPIEGAHALHV